MNFPFTQSGGQPPIIDQKWLIIERWRIDRLSGEVVDLGGKRGARRLEPTPLRLLLLLARNAGRTLCRDELVAAIWHRHFISQDSLNTAIHQIRQALDDNARQPHIVQTIPGIGYRLIAGVSEGRAASGININHHRHLKRFAAGSVAIAAAVMLLFFASPGSFDNRAAAPLLTPTLSFFDDAAAPELGHRFARQLATLVTKLAPPQPPASAQRILIESSIHEENGHFEGYVHALTIERDEILMSRRIRLSSSLADPIPSADLRALEMTLRELGAPGPRSNLASLKTADRAAFLRALVQVREDGYRGVMTASATFAGLLDSYPDNLRLMMADAEANLEIFELGSFSKKRLSRAKGLVETALALPMPHTLKGDAQALLAQIYFLKDLDVRAAEAAFEDALVLSPRNRKARARYARLLRARGRFDAAIREFAYLAAEFDDPSARLELVRTHYYAGQYETAIEGALALADAADGKTGAMLLAASAYEAKGDFEQAYFWLKTAYGQSDYKNDFMARLEVTFKANGPAGYYALILDRMLKVEASGFSVSPARMAGLALGAKRIEAAETYLAKAIEARDPGLYTLRLSPVFKTYARSNPNQGLIRRISAVAKS